MIRFLLAPRQLALHLVALVLVAAMTWLCLWQFGKAERDDQPPSERTAQTVPLEQVSTAGALPQPQDFQRLVQAQGTYLPERSVIIPNRMLGGRAGSWVITPLRMGDGSVIAVARGWVEGTPGPIQPAEGRAGSGEVAVQVSGQLLPPEQAPARPSLAPGQVAAIDLVELAPRWGNPALHEGFVVAASENPEPTPALTASLTRIPASNATISDTGAPFSNASYALQWLAFSGFVLFLWWRILRDGWRKQCARTIST